MGTERDGMGTEMVQNERMEWGLTNSGEPYSNGSPLANVTEHFGLAVPRDVMGHFKVAKGTCVCVCVCTCTELTSSETVLIHIRHCSTTMEEVALVHSEECHFHALSASGKGPSLPLFLDHMNLFLSSCRPIPWTTPFSFPSRHEPLSLFLQTHTMDHPFLFS